MNQLDNKSAEIYTKILFHNMVKLKFDLDLKIPKNINGVWYSQKYEMTDPPCTMQFVLDPSNNYMSHINTIYEGSNLITKCNWAADCQTAKDLEAAFINRFDQPIKSLALFIIPELEPDKNIISAAIQLVHTAKWGRPIAQIKFDINEIYKWDKNMSSDLAALLNHIEEE